MGGYFNPAALMSVGSSLDDDADVVEVSEEELRRIAGAELRRSCAGLKLASRMVGMAITGRDSVDDDAMLAQMQEFTVRLSGIRQTALDVVKVERGSPDYAAAFNVCTDVAMDVLTEEFKWARVGGEHVMLDEVVLKKLLEAATVDGPIFGDDASGGDLKTVRKLCILESMPKLWTVVNMFAYYQPSHEKVVQRLAAAVSEQAEHHAALLCADASPAFAERAILQRVYRVSTGLMCEVYKVAADADVQELRKMSDLERSVRLSLYEVSGMPFDHIVARHRSVMDRALDTTKLIMEAQVAPRREEEHEYAE